MTTHRLTAIHRLYEIFSRYPYHSAMLASPIYGDVSHWQAELASKPLNALPSDALSRFAAKAMTTWGSVEDFKHYLPRLFELVGEFDPPFEPWIVLGKLNYADWQGWDEKEVEAINDYLLELWQRLLTGRSAQIDACFADYFAAIANVYPDFQQLLQLWGQCNDENAVRQLALYVCNECGSLLYHKVLPGFEDSKDKGERFYRWVSAKEQLSWLERAFLNAPEAEFADSLSYAIELIEKEASQ